MANPDLKSVRWGDLAVSEKIVSGAGKMAAVMPRVAHAFDRARCASASRIFRAFFDGESPRPGGETKTPGDAEALPGELKRPEKYCRPPNALCRREQGRLLGALDETMLTVKESPAGLTVTKDRDF